MAWIRVIEPDEATGLLERIYKAAVVRAGKVSNILRVQGLLPRGLQASTQLYVALMRDDGPLSRTQREMIGTVVSRANACPY